jgi:hypothetical protein
MTIELIKIIKMLIFIKKKKFDLSEEYFSTTKVIQANDNDEL